jgi:hypothetical protein
MPDFRTLKEGYPKDKDYPDRTHHLLALGRVLDGELYDELQFSFGEEKQESGEYVPLGKRRPSVRTRFCHTVVNDSVSLLFSEGHFPEIDCKDETAREKLTTVIKESCLNSVMIEAATQGSVGSICILMRVLSGRVFFKVMKTAYLTPKWQKEAPDTLESVTECYKVKGKDLRAVGYTIKEEELNTDFWLQTVWDDKAENWFEPLKVSDQKEGKPFIADDGRSVPHHLGFVPMAWVKNLPSTDDEIDGSATFPAEAIDTQIEADYLLSQGGRGLKYQSDPTLHIKEPAMGSSGPVVKGAANAVITENGGDAKLLEITGNGAAAVMEWVKALRVIALEAMGGNRSDSDKLSTAQSGRAMELMNQSLIWLADKLRISYGEGALHSLLRMIVRASQKFPLKDKDGEEIGKIEPGKEKISLSWPAWYPPTYADKGTEATTLDLLRGAGLISQETAVKSIAKSYDIEDVQKELAAIKSDEPPPNSIAAKPVKPPLSDSQD